MKTRLKVNNYFVIEIILFIIFSLRYHCIVIYITNALASSFANFSSIPSYNNVFQLYKTSQETISYTVSLPEEPPLNAPFS